MVWKERPTLRSSFVRRNEGILVLKNKNTSDKDDSKNEDVFYSLGKQNRWMIPEMVKESGDLKSPGDDNCDFVLIERRNARPSKDEVSLYSSGKVWRGLGKKSRIQQQTSDVELIVEVTYPDSKGVRELGTNMNSKPVKRQRHSCKQRKSHMKVDEYSSWDDYLFYEDDLDTNDSDNDNEYLSHHTVCLEDFISQPSKKCKATNEHTCKHVDDTNQNGSKDYKETSIDSVQVSSLTNSEGSAFMENKVIFIEDDQLAEKHKRSFDLLRKRDIMLENIVYDTHNCKRDWCPESHCYDRKGQRRKRMKWKHKKLSEIEKEIEEHNHKEVNLKSTVTELQLEIPAEYRSCKVKLVCADLRMSELRRVWGKYYHEGQSFPRKFTIDLADPTSKLESACILFEIQGESNNHNAAIKLLLNNELLKIQEETAQMIAEDFCVALETCSDEVSVESVVDKAKICIEKHTMGLNGKIVVSPSKRSASLELTERGKGWKGEALTEEEALVAIKDEINDTPKNTDHVYCGISGSVVECGICFEELPATDPSAYTMLLSCGHSFCNNCYKMYIHTKIINRQVDLVCPQHSCEVVIDPVTIMSLVPGLYSKYFSWKMQHHLATSKSWKKCPSEQCSRVMRVSQTSDMASPSIPSQLPVSCSCNSIWCFSCQEQAHWPATCKEAKAFRASNTGYKMGKNLSYITSVFVKNCPNCKYPIEKFEGCPHMYCIMCSTEFCWNCVTVFTFDEHYYNYNCGCNGKPKEVKTRHVDLAVLMSDAERYADHAVKSFCYVKAGQTVKMHQRIKSLEQGLKAHLSLKKTSKKFYTSNMGLILDNMITNNVTDVLQKAYTFQLQAHIAVEGMAISVVSGSKSSYFEKCSMLVHVLENLAEILQNPVALYRDGKVERMKKLIKLGEIILLRL